MNYIKLWNIDHQTLLSIDYGSSNYIIYGIWITKLYYLQTILFMYYGSPNYIELRITSVEFSDHIPIWFSSWL